MRVPFLNKINMKFLKDPTNLVNQQDFPLFINIAPTQLHVFLCQKIKVAQLHRLFCFENKGSQIVITFMNFSVQLNY